MRTPTLSMIYDGVGNVVNVFDPYRARTTTEYDPANRAIKVTQPEVQNGSGPMVSPVALTEYDANGNVIKVTDANGNSTDNTYDRL